MNDKNKQLFFDDNSDYAVTITVTDEDNNEIEAEVIATLEIEDMNKEFVALMPTETPDDMEENEALIVEYSEDDNGDPLFIPIEDEELFDVVSEAFDQFFSDLMEDEEEDDDDDDGDSEDYLDNVTVLPGVSIKNE